MASIRAINQRLGRIPQDERVQVLRRVAGNIAALFGASGGGLYLIGRDRALHRLSGSGFDLMPTLCLRALSAGHHDVCEAMILPATDGAGSMISAPVIDNNTAIGVVVIGRDAGSPDFGLGDLEALEALAGVLAEFIVSRPQRLADGTGGFERIVDDADLEACLDTATDGVPARRRRAHGTAPVDSPLDFFDDTAPDIVAAQVQRVLDDLGRANRVQRRLLGDLPETMSLVAARGEAELLSIAGVYRPAFEVGGDFVDLIQVSEHRAVAVIGDVAGQGVTAALIMTQVVTDLRGLARRGLGPAEILAELNRRLVVDGQEDRFVTAVVIEIDMELQSLCVANAGHIAPLLRRQGGALFAVESEAGPPLGLIPDEVYREAAYRFELGDIAVLVTDGISEVLDPLATLTTECRLSRTVLAAGHEPDEIVRSLMAAADLFSERREDVALLALQLGG